MTAPSTNTANDLCRLTVVAPSGWADAAVPAHIPLSDILPVLVRNGGPKLVEEGMQHGGWVLQRLGEEPLAEDRTPAQLGLRDGDIVYLRHRESELPAFDFDDLLDGMATGIETRPDRWRETMTRRLFLGLLAATLGLGLAVLALGGAPQPRAIAAGAVALLLVLAGGVTSRALADSVAGALFGVTAIPYAFAGGLLGLPGGPLTAPPHLLIAFAAVTCVGTLALVAIGDAQPLFAAAIATGGFGTLGALLAAVTPAGAAGAAAIVAALALGLSPSIPGFAFRFAGLHLPPLPTGRADLQENIDPIPAEMVLRRTVLVDRYMTGLFTAVGLVCGGAVTLLAAAPGWPGSTLTAAICLLLLLRTRVLVSGWQRLAAVVPAGYGFALLVLGFAVSASAATRIDIVVFGLVVLAGVCLALAHYLPGRRLLPYWGRAAEIAESLLALSVLPLALAVLGVYAYARSLGG